MLSDIYVIKKTRSKSAGIRFLNEFIPSREYSGITCELGLSNHSRENQLDISTLMDSLEADQEKVQSLYWRCLDRQSDVSHGMIFYIENGYMIFGLSRYAANEVDESDIEEQKCLGRMKRFIGSEIGYITFECPPEDVYENFSQLALEFDSNNEEV